MSTITESAVWLGVSTMLVGGRVANSYNSYSSYAWPEGGSDGSIC